MSASLPWFRMYTDFLNDPKMITLAFEDQRHFIGVLALKCDGALDQNCPPELMDRIVAQRLWIDHAIIRDVKRRLIAAGLIGEDWQPLGWDKRQMKSDSSKERTRRYREKQKQTSDDDVTLLKRHSDVLDIDTDTDIDIEKEEKKTSKRKTATRSASLSVSDLVGHGVDPQVAHEFLAIRMKKRAPLTELALAGIKREAARVGWTLDQTLRKCIERGWQGFEASWVGTARPLEGKNRQEALEARNREVAERLARTVQ